MTLSDLGLPTPFLVRLLDSFDDGIIVKDKQGRWLYANDVTLKWFDLAKNDYMNKTGQEVAHLSTKYQKNALLYVKSDERAWLDGQESFTHLLVNAKGDERYLHVQKRVVLFDAGIEDILLVIARDITDRQLTEAQRQENELKFRTVFDYAGDAMFVSRVREGMDIRFTEVNNVACFHLGYSRNELLQMSPLDIIEPVKREEFFQRFSQRLLVQGHLTIETVHLTKAGHATPVELSIRLILLNGEQYAFTIARDISERKSHEEILYKKAYFDELTELPNSRWLAEHSLFSQHAIHARSDLIAVMAINLDNFRQVNDTYGREFGDSVLRAATKRISMLLTGAEELCRWNYEDWVVSVTRPEEVQYVSELGEKIRLALKEPFRMGSHTIFLSARIGLRLYPLHGGEIAMSIEGLVRQASLVAHEAHQSETDKIVEYSFEIESEISRRLEVADGLRYALARKELYLVYQPKWDINKTVIGMEALVRWKHPTWGVVSPAAFIPIAEEVGLIGQLGDYVLSMACEQLKSWREKGYSPIRVAVNVSVIQLEQLQFPERVQEILQLTGVKPEQLELEVTESVMMQSKQGLATLRTLHDYGITLAIDDFGTGYSSLRYLNQLPIHTLKIDQSFVSQMQREGHSNIVVTGIIQLAHNFGLAVVAEGVETASQLEMLQQRDCDAYQGYYFGRPINPDDFERKYLKH